MQPRWSRSTSSPRSTGGWKARRHRGHREPEAVERTRPARTSTASYDGLSRRRPPRAGGRLPAPRRLRHPHARRAVHRAGPRPARCTWRPSASTIPQGETVRVAMEFSLPPESIGALILPSGRVRPVQYTRQRARGHRRRAHPGVLGPAARARGRPRAPRRWPACSRWPAPWRSSAASRTRLRYAARAPAAAGAGPRPAGARRSGSCSSSPPSGVLDRRRPRSARAELTLGQASVMAPRSAPLARRAYLASTPRGVAGLGQLPVGPALGERGLVDEQVDGVLHHVDHDAVALGHERDRAAVDRLGGDVADAEAVGAAGEAPVGDRARRRRRGRRPSWRR